MARHIGIVKHAPRPPAHARIPYAAHSPTCHLVDQCTVRRPCATYLVYDLLRPDFSLLLLAWLLFAGFALRPGPLKLSS
jgi:hypothetical protein